MTLAIHMNPKCPHCAIQREISLWLLGAVVTEAIMLGVLLWPR